MSLSKATLASAEGFLSGCTARERLRNALLICPSVTSHTGRPASSHSGLGSDSAVNGSPDAHASKISAATVRSRVASSPSPSPIAAAGRVDAGAARAAASANILSRRSIATREACRRAGRVVRGCRDDALMNDDALMMISSRG